MVVLWLGLSMLSSISKHNMWSYYGWLCCMLCSVSKHNMWSYYDWVYCCCRSLVNKICGCIIVGLVVVVVREETKYVGLIVVVVRQQT